MTTLPPVESGAAPDDEHARLRAAMVDHVAAYDRTEQGTRWDPIAPAVLEALRRVPRHRFVPEALAGRAYEDTPLPIGHGQTISQPLIVALMTHLLAPERGEVVLEVGTGSGYQAAVLAELGATVHGVEIVPELAGRAAGVLAELGYDAVRVHEGDGYLGLPEEAPFDAVIVTAAPDHVPAPLIEQLAPGGRLVIPVGPAGGVQELRLLVKGDDGSIEERAVLPVRFVPLVRKPTPNRR